MSRSRCCHCDRKRGSGNGLIILILILLQFGCCSMGGHKECCGKDYYGKCGCCVDNSILFIIALYYLACCGNFSLCC